MTNMGFGKETCRPEKAEMILSMADLNGDRKVSRDQLLHTASMMAKRIEM